MRTFVVLTHEQLRLEEAADELLADLPPDLEQPVYTEVQLNRHGPRLKVSVDRIAHLGSIHSESFRDELRFLASVSDLSPMERICFGLWADGWSQAEIALKMHRCQQYVCRLLHRALLRCYDSSPLSFSAFCRHSVYRPPARRRTAPLARLCDGCGEVFDGRASQGRYCSSKCAQTGERA